MPVKLLDLDLEHGGEPPFVPPPSRYESVRLLVRDGRMPLGYLDRPNRIGELDAGSVVRTISETHLGLSVWARRDLLRRQGGLGNGEGDAAANGHLRFGISVVVCTRDRPAELEVCLSALTCQTYPQYEILVVDNGSRDRSTLDLAERFGVRYTLEPRAGLDFARNAGWSEARFPIVAYTDDDTIPDPDWLRGVAAGFASPDVHAVTGLVVPAELETRAQILFEDSYGGMGRGFRIVMHSCRGRELTFWAHKYGVGCNMAFRRAALEQLGGFDPALDIGTPTGGGGDLDMFQRVIESDAAIVYRPDAIIRHVHRRTERQLRRQAFDNGRGFCSFMLAAFGRARGYDRVRVVLALAVWFQWVGSRVIKRLVRRDSLPLAIALAEFFGGLFAPFHYARSRVRLRRIGRATGAQSA